MRPACSRSSLALLALAAPAAAGQPAGDAVDHDGRRPAALPRRRRPRRRDAADEAARRRLRPRDRAVGGRRRAREDDRKGRKRTQLQGRQPAHLPQGQLGPLRPPRARRADARHRRLLQRHRPRPGWAHAKAPQQSRRKHARTWKPKAREFFKFVKAVGTRYDGTYRDENDGERDPPARLLLVDLQRAQPGRLADAAVGEGQSTVPWSPVMYRELWYYGRAALDQTGHSNDIVLIGETAPLGSNRQQPAVARSTRSASSASSSASTSNGKPYTGSAATQAQVLAAEQDRHVPASRPGRTTRTRRLLAPTVRDTQPRLDHDGQHRRARGAARPASAPTTGRTGAVRPDDADRVRLRDQPARPVQRRLARASRPSTSTSATTSPTRTRGSSRKTQFLLRDVRAGAKRAASGKSTSSSTGSPTSRACSTPTGGPSPPPPAYTLPLRRHRPGHRLRRQRRRAPAGAGCASCRSASQTAGLAAVQAARRRPTSPPSATRSPVTNARGFFEAHRAVPGPGTLARGLGRRSERHRARLARGRRRLRSQDRETSPAPAAFVPLSLMNPACSASGARCRLRCSPARRGIGLDAPRSRSSRTTTSCSSTGPTTQRRALDDIARARRRHGPLARLWNQIAPDPRPRRSARRASTARNPAALRPGAAGTATTTSCAAPGARHEPAASRPRARCPAGRSDCGGSVQTRATCKPDAEPVRAVRPGARHALLRRATPTRTRAAACCRASSAGRSGTSPTSPAG